MSKLLIALMPLAANANVRLPAAKGHQRYR
jgi:hypothetical protein